MRIRTLEIGVGLFLLAGLLALLLLSLRVSGLNVDSSDTYKLYAYFDNIAGLSVRSKVTMAGVTIGKVTAIDLDSCLRLLLQQSLNLPSGQMCLAAAMYLPGSFPQQQKQRQQ